MTDRRLSRTVGVIDTQPEVGGMTRQTGHTLERTKPGGMVRLAHPRLPGEDGAMSFMDTVADLVRSVRDVHDPTRPEWQTAADVLAWAGDELPDEVTDRLALGGLYALGGPDFPGHRLSDGLAEWVAAGSPEQSLASWRSWPGADQRQLLAQGLAEYARSMPTDYRSAYHTGDAYQARLLVALGWVPSLLGAIAAGAIAAALSADAWVFAIVAPGALVLGCIATLGAWSAAGSFDLRWHLFGRHWWTAAVLIVLLTGPAAATAVAVAVLSIR
jgi:hypothetical protein